VLEGRGGGGGGGGGTRWRSWLRRCATSQKVAGSIPDGVTRIFHWNNPSFHTMALRLTQPRTEMSKGKAVPLQARGAQRVQGS